MITKTTNVNKGEVGVGGEKNRISHTTRALAKNKTKKAEEKDAKTFLKT